MSATPPAARDHGGNLTAAIASYGGAWEDWIDLSTGINPAPYPVGEIAPALWARLPDLALTERLIDAARAAYGAAGCIAVTAGAQQAIDTIPHLYPAGEARILAPTYNEHAAALRHAGWRVTEVATLDALRGADLAVVVNPNNPDGACYTREALLALLADVGVLVVDESFGDPVPALSLAGDTGREGLWVLRSFGKFYGLAGIRLGFALAAPAAVEALTTRLGPWPVNGPAMAIGTRALRDVAWQEETIVRLCADSARLDALVPWTCVGGTPLFRLYRTPDAAAVQAHLARHHIWTRIFPYSPHLVRLGLPHPAQWARLEASLRGLTERDPANG